VNSAPIALPERTLRLLSKRKRAPVNPLEVAAEFARKRPDADGRALMEAPQ
jgi:hypothetical protein